MLRDLPSLPKGRPVPGTGGRARLGVVVAAACLAASPICAARVQRHALRAAAPADPAAYQPPTDSAVLESDFWQEIYRLERRQTGSTEVEQLADAFRTDLGKLRAEERLAVMRLVLAASRHYDGKEDGTLAEELRRRHDERFADRLRDLALLSRRLKEASGESAAQRLFARIRALAGPGLAGLELSRRLAEADPQNGSVLTRLAADLADTGDCKGAVEAAERAIRLSTDIIRAYTILASAKYQLKDYAGANASANMALAQDPGDKVAYAIVTLTQERMPVAAQAAGDAAALDVTDDAAHERRDAMGAAAPPAPGAVQSAVQLAEQARTALRARDYDLADALATQALQKDPNNAPALYRRALSRMRRERLDEALADTEAAMKIMGENPSPILLTLHAQALNRLNRFAAALPFAERALALNPASDRSRSQAMFQKAWALAGTGERKGALKILAQAARLNRRLVPFYQEASAQPEDGDMTLVFASDWLAQDAPPAAPAPPAAGAGWLEALGSRRSLVILVFSLAGGFLIAMGIMRMSAARAPAPTPVLGPGPSAGGLLAGTYRLERRIGAGGMGIVYEAFDVNLERRVAIKKMRDEICADPKERERFMREARTVAALKHPNIVEIHAVVGDGSDVYLVFERVDGHTVTEYLQAYQRIPFEQAVRVVQGAAAALDYAHARGVVHRDLKPSNIMITREGVVKVMDFGVARQAKDTLGMSASTETVAGTPQYMPPEQEQGTVRAESDVFALGVCFYEMVTGVLPFQGVGMQMALNKSRKTYAPASRLIEGLPAGSDEVVDWALWPDLVHRCPTPLRFAAALDTLLRPRIGLKPPDQLT